MSDAIDLAIAEAKHNGHRRGLVVSEGGNVWTIGDEASGLIVTPPTPLRDPLQVLAASERVWWVRRNATGWWGCVFAADAVTPSVSTLACPSYEAAVIDLATRWAGVAEFMAYGDAS